MSNVNTDNGNPYVSSIVSLYGDVDNVKRDVATLNDILSRQGSRLLTDVIAEHIGQAKLNHNFSPVEVKRIKALVLEELSNAIIERT